MRHFQLIGTVDPTPLLNQLQRMPELWNENDLRTTHPQSPHTSVSDIWVWFNEVRKDHPEYAIDEIQTKPYRAWKDVPAIRPMIFDLMRRLEAVQLGRVIITKLPPGCEIGAHTDQGTPATFYHRYQIILQSLPGVIFRCEDEQATFRSGEVWFVNNRVEHSVVNNSADDRIVMIIDVRHA